MPTDRQTGLNPRGFAFVTMGNPEIAAETVQQGN